MKFKFLGSSDSAGIPVHNCNCLACENYRKNNKKNPSNSAYLETKDGVILFDAGNDDISSIFDSKKIKAIFLTHFHADHVLGLLKLRHSKDEITCYHPKEENGFSDLFKHKKSINYIENTPLETIEIDDLKITPIPLLHSKNTTGYIIQTPSCNIAYLTDCAGIKDEYIEYLKTYEFDYVFIDACFVPPKKGNHLNYEDASDIIDSLNVKNGFLMHQSHENLEYILKNDIKLKYKYVNEDFSINLH